MCFPSTHFLHWSFTINYKFWYDSLIASNPEILERQGSSHRIIDIKPNHSNTMTTAFVLINCELSSEAEIIENLKGIEGVRETNTLIRLEKNLD